MVDSKVLLEAVQQNNSTAVKLLVKVKKDIPPETRNVLGKTIAEIAASKGNLSIMKYVLKENASLLKNQEFKNMTLLRLAIIGNFLEMVKYLVEDCKAEILTPHCLTSGDTYVHLAAELGRLDILKYFIEEQKVDVNLKNDLGQPVIFAAARSARLDVIKYMVEGHKANVSVIDSLSRNIFSYSAQKGDLKVPKYLLDKKKFKIAVNNTLIVHDAIAQAYNLRANKRANFIKYFVERKRVNVNSRDKGGKTPLHLAAREGRLSTLKYLVYHGGNIQLGSLKGQTSLHLAASEGKLNIVDYLIQNGADIQPKDSEGKTPLHLAAREGKLGVVDYLIRKGANVYIEDSKGNTPREIATNEKVITYLEKAEKKRPRRSLFKPFTLVSPQPDQQILCKFMRGVIIGELTKSWSLDLRNNGVLGKPVDIECHHLSSISTFPRACVPLSSRVTNNTCKIL